MDENPTEIIPADRSEYGYNFKGDPKNGCWKTTGTPTVFVYPPSSKNKHWRVKCLEKVIDQEFKGEYAQMQAFYSAKNIALRR